MLKAIFLFLGLMILSVPGSAQTLARVEAELLGHLDNLDKASNYGGTSDYDLLGKENLALQNALVKYGTRVDVLRYAFPKIKEKITIVTSKDGKLRAYSWDTNEGGTMHDFITVYQFQGRSGKVYPWTEPFTQSMEKRGAGPFVAEIATIEAAGQPLYLIASTFIGSTSLAGQIISAFKINGDKLDHQAKVFRTGSGLKSSITFEYDFFSVVDHPERPIKLVYFDTAKKTFRFPIVIVDKKTPQGRVTNRFITYRFNGTEFVKVG